MVESNKRAPVSSPACGGGAPEGSGGGFQRNRRATAQAKKLRQKMTKAETILWTVLRRRALQGFRFRRQHPIGPYVADFSCLNAGLVVEVDGATHSSKVQIEKDTRRTAFLNQQGFSVLRVTNLDIYQDLDGVVRGISAALAPLDPSGHSPRKRGETPRQSLVSSPACGGLSRETDQGSEGSGGGL